MRTHLCGALRAADIGSRVRLCGWMAKRREHGEHLAFIDLRDHTGIVQCVVPGTVDVRSEYVLAVEGTVRARPEGTVNPELPTGEVEIGDCTGHRAQPGRAPALRGGRPGGGRRGHPSHLPLCRPSPAADAGQPAHPRHGEPGHPGRPWTHRASSRSRPRCCGRRRPRGLASSSCPAGMSPGSGYVLPQSPQLAKQLLMVAGLDRYYQIARCLRDEDLRADRQFEFTQLDLEASFVGQDDVLGFVSEAVLGATEAVSGSRPDRRPRASPGSRPSTATAPTSPTSASAWSCAT